MGSHSTPLHSAVHIFWQLAQAKALEAPRALQKSTALMWERRWTRMLSVSCASAFAASLVSPKHELEDCVVAGGEVPILSELCAWRDQRVANPCRQTYSVAQLFFRFLFSHSLCFISLSWVADLLF